MKRSLLLATALVAIGCGARGGGPLPPLRPLPPAIGDLEITQRGTDAVFHFAPVPPTANVEGLAVPINRIELLALTERYPVITPEVLATALQAERRERMALAREAAERAERTLARQRGDELEEEAAVEVEEPEPEEAEETLSPEEILLRRIPSDARIAWREQGIRPEVLLESARRLERAIDELWEELEMPPAIVDLRNAPELPDPVRVIEAAEKVASRLSYEGGRSDVNEFLREAVVVAAVPIADLDEYRTGDTIQFVHELSPPADDSIRSRTVFAVRAVSERGQEGAVGGLLSLAPDAVPAPPVALAATVTREGVRLAWEPPAADVTGDLLEPDEISYNVYRRRAGIDVAVEDALNELPLREPMFLDEETGWDESWVYEVRALRAGGEPEEDEPAPPVAFAERDSDDDGPLKESFGAVTEPLLAADLYPPGPPSELEAVRAGRTVTLRWAEAGDDDIAGYRVYRHPAPMPELPGWAPETETEAETDESTEEETGEVEQAEAAAEPTEIEAAGSQQEGGAEQEADSQERLEQRVRRNLLVAAGWELLTAVPVTEPRYIDPASDPAVHWIYVVEALDEAGNVSAPRIVELEPANTEQERPR